MTELGSRAAALLGIVVFVGIAWAFSEHRRKFPWRVVAWGLALQLGLALLLLRSPASAATVPVASVNTIDAAASGAIAGLRLAASVGALLLAFVALLTMANAGLEHVGGWIGVPGLTRQRVLGWVFAPVALLLGVAPAEAQTVGALLGIKTVLNELLAYRDLGGLVASGAISPRGAVISSYALCGFANFGSLAILLGGVGSMVPERRPEIARLGLRAILSGTLASLMTESVAAVFV